MRMLQEILLKRNVRIGPMAALRDVKSLMQKNRLTTIPVVKDNQLMGMVTLNQVFEHSSNRLVCDAMTKGIVATQVDCSLDEALKLMKRKNLDTIPVLDGKKLIGLITIQEIVKELLSARKKVEEYSEYSKGLEQKVRDRTFELSILYEISNIISYTLDYQQLLRLIMESLFKIVDYDICASLIFDAHTANIALKSVYPGSNIFLEEAKNKLIYSTSILSGEDIAKKSINTYFIPPGTPSSSEAESPEMAVRVVEDNLIQKSNPIQQGKPKEETQGNELRTFINVPFIVRDKIIGMINVSSCKKNAFSENDVRLIYTITNQASNAIERLQAVITGEKSKMESMVKSMAEGVIMLDKKGEIVVLNPKARQILGFRLDEEVTKRAMNRKMKALSLPTAVEECQGNGKKRLITEEITISQKNQIKKDVRCDVTPVKDVNDKIIGIVTILRDITKEKEIDRMKSEFISVVGHELRTPLTSMKNAVDIILGETAGAINENQRRFLSMADRNIDRLSGIINELLDISKIESGSIKTELKPLDLGAPFDMAIASLASKAEKKSISLHKEMPSDLPQIYGDSNKLEQIFINLLSNAIKFTPEGGHVFVSARLVHSSEFGVQSEEKTKKDYGLRTKNYELDRDLIKVSVADTGIGISPDELEKIFDRFYQVEKSLTRETEGTGLGLSIVKGLVEAHGGEIWVESEEGKKGSKFTFTLPKYSPERVLKEYLDREIAGAGEKGAPLSLMMLKIEEFEYLSETYGEAETLKLLDDVKGIIQDTARRTTDMIKTQTPGRILVILPDTPKEGSVALGNRIKEVFSKQTFTLSKDSMKINLVSGLATYPEDGVTADELIKKVQSQFKIKEAVSTVEKVVGR